MPLALKLSSTTYISLFLTAELKSYWTVPTFHAVVVTGLDDELIYLHDPYFPDAPKEVQRDEFLLAWLEQDYWYAVIRLTDRYSL